MGPRRLPWRLVHRPRGDRSKAEATPQVGLGYVEETNLRHQAPGRAVPRESLSWHVVKETSMLEVMLYLSVILSGRCFNVAPADVGMPPPEYQCETKAFPAEVNRPPIFIPPAPPRPCGCEKDERPEPKPLPLLFLPKVILNGHL